MGAAETATRLERNGARVEVRPDLALYALEGVVHGLRVALEGLAYRLVGMTVEIERQHRALELRQHARQAGHEALQLLRGDHLVHGVVRRGPGQELIEGGVAVA